MSLLTDLKTASDVHHDIAAAAKARRLAMNITQNELSSRSGVAIATLKRFETGGPASLTTVLAVAEALDALTEFGALFSAPEASSLDEIEAASKAPKRVRARRRS